MAPPQDNDLPSDVEFLYFLAQSTGEEDWDSLGDIVICVTVARIVSDEDQTPLLLPN